MSSNQRKQVMSKGFLHCAVVVALAMCGIAPCDRAISTASPTSKATGGSSAHPRPTQRQGSCASRPINRRKLERQLT
jgi:hypothetical protein